jgi:hypothetical protein
MKSRRENEARSENPAAAAHISVAHVVGGTTAPTEVPGRLGTAIVIPRTIGCHTATEAPARGGALNQPDAAYPVEPDALISVLGYGPTVRV